MQDLIALREASLIMNAMLEATPEYGLTRFGATAALVRNDLQTGMDGNDFMTNTMEGVRNVFVATYHGIQGIIPSIANSMNDQRFNVVPRGGPLHGTSNSVKKIIETKGFIGKASAVLAEATDGPLDDALHVVGGAEWIVEPSKS